MQLRSYRAVTENTVYINVVMGHFLAAKTLTFKKKAKSKTFLVKTSFT